MDINEYERLSNITLRQKYMFDPNNRYSHSVLFMVSEECDYVSLLREICKAVSNICLILNSMFFNRFHISLKLCWFVDICRVIITKDHTGSKENRNQHGEHLLLIDQPKMALSNNNIVQTTEKSMIPDKETIIMIPTVENSMTQDKENCQVYIKQGSLFPPI